MATPRGFGIDATTPSGVIREVARAAEAAGYHSFWLNGSPPRKAMEGIATAAEVTSFPLGIGVLPFDRRPIEILIQDALELEIPVERFWMGVGWGGSPVGALDRMRDAVNRIADLGARPVVGAFGPNMTRLGGEISEGVIFTWWFREAIEESRTLVIQGAERAGREPPPIISYIRCALLPQAQAALNEVAGRYDSIPRFRALFHRHQRTAHDTVVTGRSSAELRPRIEWEEAVLDYAIIRAIVPDHSIDAFHELLEACRPQ